MSAPRHSPVSHTLRLRRLGIDTYQEAVIYMRRDCHVCRAEGFEAQSRIDVECRGRRRIRALARDRRQDARASCAAPAG